MGKEGMEEGGNKGKEMTAFLRPSIEMTSGRIMGPPHAKFFAYTIPILISIQPLSLRHKHTRYPPTPSPPTHTHTQVSTQVSTQVKLQGGAELGMQS